MIKTMTRLLTLTALLLGAAHAGSATTSATGTAAASASAVGTAAGSSSQVSVSAVVLLDTQGRVIGTANSAGQFVFQGSSRAATRAQVTFRNGLKRTYDLSGSLQAQARASLDSVVVAGNGQSLTLTQVIRTEVQAQAGAPATRALSGKSVTLLGVNGQVIGGFDASGQWKGNVSAAQATEVLITLQNGQRATYALTQSLSVDTRSAVNLDRLQVRANNRSEALINVLLSGTANGAGTGTGNVSTSSSAAGSTSSAGTATGAGGTTSAGASGSAGGTASGSSDQGGAGIGVSVGVGVGVGVGIGGGK